MTKNKLCHVKLPITEAKIVLISKMKPTSNNLGNTTKLTFEKKGSEISLNLFCFRSYIALANSILLYVHCSVFTQYS